VYWPGLSGSFIFDDYPNIVDNSGVQPHDASLPSLVRATLSSPASEFKRPLASLSFAANYLATGLDPYWAISIFSSTTTPAIDVYRSSLCRRRLYDQCNNIDTDDLCRNSSSPG